MQAVPHLNAGGSINRRQAWAGRVKERRERNSMGQAYSAQRIHRVWEMKGRGTSTRKHRLTRACDAGAQPDEVAAASSGQDPET
jgi:hypothetical protein